MRNSELRFHVVFFVTLGFLGQVQAQENTADLKYEDRISRIYQNYNQSNVTDLDWGKIAGEKMSEKYSLSNGDTLWDISEKFFGNGFYWPKVWQLNDKITNPHFVYSGGILNFTPGSDVSPPALGLAGAELGKEDPANVDDDVEDTEEFEVRNQDKPDELVKGTIVIPKGRHQGPILSHIPPSFFQWKGMFGNFDDNGFAIETSKAGMKKMNIESYVPSILVDSSWDNAGYISEMEGMATVASNYQKVFIKLGQTASPGDVFTVYSEGKKVEDPGTGVERGHIVLLKGTVTVKEAMNIPHTYSAMVSHAIGALLVNDLLVPGDALIKVSYEANGPASNVSARVLAVSASDTMFDSESYLFGLHQTIYLDRGQKDGMQVGSILPIYKNFNVRNPDSKLTTDSDITAKAKIVHVEEGLSTAVIIRSREAVMPGDETGIVPDTGQNQTPAEPAATQNNPEG